METIIRDLISNVTFEKKERFSKLSYAGYKKFQDWREKLLLLHFQ